MLLPFHNVSGIALNLEYYRGAEIFGKFTI